MTNNLGGMSTSVSISVESARDAIGDGDLANCLAVFGAANTEAVDIFAEQTSMLGEKIRAAKITYVNTDQRAAQLTLPSSDSPVHGPR